MKFIGIDPGLTGAVAEIDEKGKFINVHDAPVVKVKKGGKSRQQYIDAEMGALLRRICTGDVSVCMEELHAMKQGTSSNFSCGLGSGLWRGIVAVLDVPFCLVLPGRWKKDMQIETGSNKGQSLIVARRMFPKAPLTLAMHHGRAEALLIAEWHRRSILNQKI